MKEELEDMFYNTKKGVRAGRGGRKSAKRLTKREAQRKAKRGEEKEAREELKRKI